MDNQLYESTLRYFTTLSNYGYKCTTDVKKLILFAFIQELVTTTSISINEEDYRHLERALYCLYGTSCLIPFPNYCENLRTRVVEAATIEPDSSTFLVPNGYLGDIAELASRMSTAEDAITTIGNTEVIKVEL